MNGNSERIARSARVNLLHRSIGADTHNGRAARVAFIAGITCRADAQEKELTVRRKRDLVVLMTSSRDVLDDDFRFRERAIGSATRQVDSTRCRDVQIARPGTKRNPQSRAAADVGYLTKCAKPSLVLDNDDVPVLLRDV